MTDARMEHAQRSDQSGARGWDFRPEASAEHGWPIWPIIAVLVVSIVLAGALAG